MKPIKILFWLLTISSSSAFSLGNIFGNTLTNQRLTDSEKPTNNESSDGPICGRRKIQHIGLIKGGQKTNPGDWPWHAAIYMTKSGSVEQKYHCGGSLLTTARVLTAGHCVVEYRAVIVPGRLFVFLGKYNLVGGDVEPQEKEVFQVVLHPEYSYGTLKNDIAILKLSSEVKYTQFIQPICLWNKKDVGRENIMNTEGTVVGWGFTEINNISNKLMKAVITVVPDLKCLKKNTAFYSNFLTEDSYCAGFANGTGACNGDSGGGMFFPRIGDDGIETWHIRGIVSLSVPQQGTRICDPNYYNIFTDVAQYLDFIHDNLNLVDDDKDNEEEKKKIIHHDLLGNLFSSVIINKLSDTFTKSIFYGIG